MNCNFYFLSEEAADLAELKSVFQYWAGSESDLTDPLCEMASAIDKVRQSVESELLNTENLFLFQVSTWQIYPHLVKWFTGVGLHVKIFLFD